MDVDDDDDHVQAHAKTRQPAQSFNAYILRFPKVRTKHVEAIAKMMERKDGRENELEKRDQVHTIPSRTKEDRSSATKPGGLDHENWRKHLICKGYKTAEEAFAKFDKDGNGTISRAEFEVRKRRATRQRKANPTVQQACRASNRKQELLSRRADFATSRLGIYDASQEYCSDMKYAITDEVKNEIFAASDLDNNARIDFKEFIILLATITMVSGDASETSKDFRQALETVNDMFLFFDINRDGKLNVKEVKKRMKVPPSQGTMGLSEDLFSRRFEEMDWDHNGVITYQEFLLATELWVGLEEGGEE